MQPVQVGFGAAPPMCIRGWERTFNSMGSFQAGPAFLAHIDGYLFDVKFGIIMDVDASGSTHEAEVGAVKIIIDRT